jgi:hypothetical protein
MRSNIAEYMLSAPLVTNNPVEADPGEEGSEQKDVWLRSDGEWLWSTSDAKSFQTGELELEEEFVAHVTKKQIPPSNLSKEQLDAAMHFVAKPASNMIL